MTKFYDAVYSFERVGGYQFVKLYISMFEKWLESPQWLLAVSKPEVRMRVTSAWGHEYNFFLKSVLNWSKNIFFLFLFFFFFYVYLLSTVGQSNSPLFGSVMSSLKTQSLAASSKKRTWRRCKLCLEFCPITSQKHRKCESDNPETWHCAGALKWLSLIL